MMIDKRSNWKNSVGFNLPQSLENVCSPSWQTNALMSRNDNPHQGFHTHKHPYVDILPSTTINAKKTQNRGHEKIWGEKGRPEYELTLLSHGKLVSAGSAFLERQFRTCSLLHHDRRLPQWARPRAKSNINHVMIVRGVLLNVARKDQR
jgi:hypothetical protein